MLFFIFSFSFFKIELFIRTLSVLELILAFRTYQVPLLIKYTQVKRNYPNAKISDLEIYSISLQNLSILQPHKSEEYLSYIYAAILKILLPILELSFIDLP